LQRNATILGSKSVIGLLGVRDPGSGIRAAKREP
jgi:hypothetical protein